MQGNFVAGRKTVLTLFTPLNKYAKDPPHLFAFPVICRVGEREGGAYE